jgi:hypothetical protein
MQQDTENKNILVGHGGTCNFPETQIPFSILKRLQNGNSEPAKFKTSSSLHPTREANPTNHHDDQNLSGVSPDGGSLCLSSLQLSELFLTVLSSTQATS